MSRELRQALAAGAPSLGLPLRTGPLELRRIPAGEFLMGSPPDEPGHQLNEEHVRPIRISRAFYLGRFPVTQAEYRAVTGLDRGADRGDRIPVHHITYAEARAFCRQLAQSLGVPLTLPTEAQWEYACRAGTQTRFHAGATEADLARVAWYKANAGGRAHPVGEKEPNAWGLYDMHGNVFEYCLDLIADLDGIPGTDPVGTVSDTQGAMRGGTWGDPPECCRSAYRVRSHPWYGGAGFRVALNPEAAEPDARPGKTP